MFRAAGAKITAVPVDAHGMFVDNLKQAGQIRLVHFTPSYQFPTGITMSLARSPFWALPTTVGNATRAEPSPYGGSLRKSEWLRNSKPSRLSFNAECMIAWPKSVHGSGRLCWVITNITLFPGTRLNCASSNVACAGYGRAFWSAAVSVHRCVGIALTRSAPLS